MTIWKSTLNPFQHQQTLDVPKGSKFLWVQAQGDLVHGVSLTIWYSVPERTAPGEPREIVIMMTGQEYEFPVDVLTHIGSCIHLTYVLHVFELVPGYRGPGWKE